MLVIADTADDTFWLQGHMFFKSATRFYIQAGDTFLHAHGETFLHAGTRRHALRVGSVGSVGSFGGRGSRVSSLRA